MPKSRNRKQHKVKKVKNRKALELKREQEKHKMKKFMDEMIAKLNRENNQVPADEQNIPVLADLGEAASIFGSKVVEDAVIVEDGITDQEVKTETVSE